MNHFCMPRQRVLSGQTSAANDSGSTNPANEAVAEELNQLRAAIKVYCNLVEQLLHQQAS